MNATLLLILVLATWRITNLIVDDSEDGPFGLLHKIRYLMGVRYDERERPYGKNEMGKAITCLWCASLWVGAGVTLLARPLPWPQILLLPFALSTGALLTNKLVKR